MTRFAETRLGHVVVNAAGSEKQQPPLSLLLALVCLAINNALDGHDVSTSSLLRAFPSPALNNYRLVPCIVVRREIMTCEDRMAEYD